MNERQKKPVGKKNHESFFKFFKNLPGFEIGIDRDNIEDLSFFRARPFNDVDKEKIADFNEFSSPPKKILDLATN